MNQNSKDHHPSQFSLFEGDLFNRGFSLVGVGSRKPIDILIRFFIIFLITWVPMALLSMKTAMLLPANAPYAENFFYDFAAYAQFFVGIPLYLIAERVVGESIMGASRDFHDSGIISEEDKPKLKDIEKKVEVVRKKFWPEAICIGISFFFAFMAFAPELVRNDPNMVTWHVDPITHKEFLFWTLTHWYTPAGMFATFAALPIQTYIWVRWVCKIWIWYWYLRQVSKFKLNLVASHPDHTGGVGFLSEVQAKFALVILAGGISGVVATVGYKIAIEHAPVDLPPVYGLVFGFAIGAPILFLAPLLLFTKQLARTKKRALAQYREKAMAIAQRVESGWLFDTASDKIQDAQAKDELAQLNLLSGFYDRIHGMRVVPFDLRSGGQLFGSAIGPLLPLVPYFFHLEGPWKEVFEALTKWIPGHH